MSTTFLDALLGLPAMAGAALSPDGRHVAWTWLRVRPTGDVYVTRTDGRGDIVRLTDFGQDTWVASWTPDSTGLIVEHDHDGDERVALYRVDISKPLAAQRLTEEHPPYFMQGGDLHPNGRYLVYAMNYDAKAGREIEPTWVYRHDLDAPADSARRVLARPKEASDVSPALNDQGTHVLYTRSDLDPAGDQVWLVDIEGWEDREILNFGADKKVAASWLPDGKRVLFLTEAERGGRAYRKLGVWEDGREIRWLVDDPRRNIEDAFVPERSEWVVVLEEQAARPVAGLLHLETGEEVPLPPEQGNLVPLGLAGHKSDEGEAIWVGQLYAAQQPTELVTFAVARAQPVGRLGYVEPLRWRVGYTGFDPLTLVWTRTGLTAADLTPAEGYAWRSVDGLRIHGWLYRTPVRPARGTVVVVHGGPTGHSEDRFGAQIQFLVREGFHVLDPNYRGSTGYGLEFQDKIKEDGWGGREMDDIRTGIQALIADGIATPHKVGITGTSYGGYASWWAITHFPHELCAAAAPICGMTDLVVDYYSTRPDLRPYSEEMLGGSPEDEPQRYRERSPVQFVGAIRGRLLIVQGLQDPNVTPRNVTAVREALDAAGVAYEVLAFPDEGHGIARPQNQRALYQRLSRFFGEAFA